MVAAAIAPTGAPVAPFYPPGGLAALQVHFQPHARLLDALCCFQTAAAERQTLDPVTFLPLEQLVRRAESILTITILTITELFLSLGGLEQRVSLRRFLTL